MVEHFGALPNARGHDSKTGAPIIEQRQWQSLGSRAQHSNVGAGQERRHVGPIAEPGDVRLETQARDVLPNPLAVGILAFRADEQKVGRGRTPHHECKRLQQRRVVLLLSPVGDADDAEPRHAGEGRNGGTAGRRHDEVGDVSNPLRRHTQGGGGPVREQRADGNDACDPAR